MFDRIWRGCRIAGMACIAFFIGMIIGTIINMTMLQSAFYDRLDARAETADEQPYDRHVYDFR